MSAPSARRIVAATLALLCAGVLPAAAAPDASPDDASGHRAADPVAEGPASAHDAAGQLRITPQATTADRVIVTLTDGADAHAAGARLVEVLVEAGAAGAETTLVATHAGALVLDAVPARLLHEVLNDPEVLDVSPEVLVGPQLARSLPHIGADRLHAGGSRGRGAAVAVIDTGVDRDHPALAGAVTHEACFVTPAADNGHSTCPDGTARQIGIGAAAPCAAAGCRHGTHVAGIAVGRAVGGQAGGVAPQATLVAVQVFDRTGGLAASGDIVAALDWVLGLRRGGHAPVVAVNLSLGGGLYGGTCDLGGLRRIVERLREAGVATVAAAGNQGADQAISWPACTTGVLAVGASDLDDRRLPVSNSSPQLDLYAPGVRITAPVPGGGYASMSGTSMATPHVAGAIAATGGPPAGPDGLLRSLLSTGPSLTAAGISRQRLELGAIHVAPARPRSVRASHGDRQATVRWEPGPGVSGVTVSGYEITMRPGGRRVQVGPDARSATITGLDNRVRYTAEVRSQARQLRSSARTSNVVIPKPTPPAHRFRDVPRDAYFGPAVAWAKAEEVTAGATRDTFAPADHVTRAQMVAFLWRLAGRPEGHPAHGFRDVPRGAYFDDAVRWARATDVTVGVDAAHFGPGDRVTRAQMATFLWRLAGRPEGHPTHAFRDVPRGAHFQAPVTWASATGVALGTSSDRFAPHAPVTRAQMAAFLWRLASTAEAWHADAAVPDTVVF